MARDITSQITALLEKAQSTNFEAEAQAFYDKAQELMRKYAIEEAQLWAKGEVKENPEIRKVILTSGKRNAGLNGLRTLIYACAKFNRCTSWYTEGTGTAHIAGFESDLNYVELLFNSLRLFGENALVWASIESNEHHRTFDSGFWNGFATRIYSRLAANEVSDSNSTALVLVDRTKAVDKFLNDQGFKFTKGQGSSDRSYDGRRAGAEAGSKASLNPRDSLGSKSKGMLGQ